MNDLGSAHEKPGVIALRPLRIGEILEGAVSTIRRHPGLLLGSSFVVVAVAQLLGLLIYRTVYPEIPVIVLDGTGLSLQEWLDLLMARAPALILMMLTQPVLSGLVTVVLGKAVLGKGLSWREAWERVRPRLPKLLGLTVLYTLIVAAVLALPMVLAGLVGGTGGAALILVGIVLAVYLGVLFSLASPALVLEPAGIRESLRRSALLVRGAWGRVFGMLLLAGLASFVLDRVIQLPFVAALGPNADGLGAELVRTLGASVAGMVTTPFLAAVTVLIYIDQRMRRENMQAALTSAAANPDD